jgi:hypothetical protein
MILSMPLEGGVTWMNGERAVDEREYRRSRRAVQVQKSRQHCSIERRGFPATAELFSDLLSNIT